MTDQTCEMTALFFFFARCFVADSLNAKLNTMDVSLFIKLKHKIISVPRQNVTKVYCEREN
jgi:hypothetical protein